jgi:hypothetical protein
MTRYARTIDVATGLETLVPYTPAEEAAADAAAEAEANKPVPFRDIPRPSFLFMMSKMGLTETLVEGLIGQMPAGDARDLALIVFRNQQTFKRDNSLLNTLTVAAGLTSEQVDTAWRAAEQLTW